MIRRAVKAAHATKLFEDAVQEARLGVHRAAVKFDASKGERFWSYAFIWAVSRARRLRATDHLIRMGGTLAEGDFIVQVAKAEQALRKLGEEPTATLVSEMTGIEYDIVFRCLAGRDSGVLDLYSTRGGSGNSGIGGHTLLMDLIPDERIPDPDEQLPSLPGFDQKVERFMKLLTRRELQIFDDRLWTVPERRTLKEIGDDWGVSRERIRQNEKAVIEYMRSYFSKELHELGYGHGASLKPWPPRGNEKGSTASTSSHGGGD